MHFITENNLSHATDFFYSYCPNLLFFPPSPPPLFLPIFTSHCSHETLIKSYFLLLERRHHAFLLKTSISYHFLSEQMFQEGEQSTRLNVDESRDPSLTEDGVPDLLTQKSLVTLRKAAHIDRQGESSVLMDLK